MSHSYLRPADVDSTEPSSVQIVMDASLPDAADGLSAMEDAEFEEAVALSKLLESPVPNEV